MLDFCIQLDTISKCLTLFNKQSHLKNGTSPLKILEPKSLSQDVLRAEHGNLGDVKTLGSGISEMRIDVGAGYRIYFKVRERVIVILLVGGIKSSQQSDIKKAIQLAKEF